MFFSCAKLLGLLAILSVSQVSSVFSDTNRITFAPIVFKNGSPLIFWKPVVPYEGEQEKAYFYIDNSHCGSWMVTRSSPNDAIDYQLPAEFASEWNGDVEALPKTLTYPNGASCTIQAPGSLVDKRFAIASVPLPDPSTGSLVKANAFFSDEDFSNGYIAGGINFGLGRRFPYIPCNGIAEGLVRSENPYVTVILSGGLRGWHPRPLKDFETVGKPVVWTLASSKTGATMTGLRAIRIIEIDPQNKNELVEEIEIPVGSDEAVVEEAIVEEDNSEKAAAWLRGFLVSHLMECNTMIPFDLFESVNKGLFGNRCRVTCEEGICHVDFLGTFQELSKTLSFVLWNGDSIPISLENLVRFVPVSEEESVIRANYIGYSLNSLPEEQAAEIKKYGGLKPAVFLGNLFVRDWAMETFFGSQRLFGRATYTMAKLPRTEEYGSERKKIEH